MGNPSQYWKPSPVSLFSLFGYFLFACISLGLWNERKCTLTWNSSHYLQWRQAFNFNGKMLCKHNHSIRNSEPFSAIVHVSERKSERKLETSKNPNKRTETLENRNNQCDEAEERKGKKIYKIWIWHTSVFVCCKLMLNIKDWTISCNDFDCKYCFAWWAASVTDIIIHHTWPPRLWCEQNIFIDNYYNSLLVMRGMPRMPWWFFHCIYQACYRHSFKGGNIERK